MEKCMNFSCALREVFLFASQRNHCQFPLEVGTDPKIFARPPYMQLLRVAMQKQSAKLLDHPAGSYRKTCSNWAGLDVYRYCVLHIKSRYEGGNREPTNLTTKKKISIFHHPFCFTTQGPALHARCTLQRASLASWERRYDAVELAVGGHWQTGWLAGWGIQRKILGDFFGRNPAFLCIYIYITIYIYI